METKRKSFNFITRIILRYDTTENLNKANPILKRGEICIEEYNAIYNEKTWFDELDGISVNNVTKIKVGDGIKHWKDLEYINSIDDDQVYRIITRIFSSRHFHLCQRRDTAENWNRSNPLLKEGELGIEFDDEYKSVKLKVGDGIRRWNSLNYITSDIPEDTKQQLTCTNKLAIMSVILNILLTLLNILFSYPLT